MGYRVKTRGFRVRRSDDGGLLVYDERADVGHVLNPTVAVVYDLCDGSMSVGDMAQRVASQTGLPADEEIVVLALAQLREAGILDEAEPTTAALATVNTGLTRRSLLKRLAAGAGALALLPAIDSISGVSQLAADTGLTVFAAVAISVVTTAGQPVTVQLSVTGQPGSGTLTFNIVDPPQHGTATISGDLLTYTPNPGFVGTDTMTYQAILNPSTTTTGTSTSGSTTMASTPTTPASSPTTVATTSTPPPSSPSSSIGTASIHGQRGDSRRAAVGAQTVNAQAVTSTIATVTVTVDPASAASPTFTG